jgi:hypothetical protein
MADSQQITTLVGQVETLANEVIRLRGKTSFIIFAVEVTHIAAGESDVRKLHHKYGYYLDKCLYKEVRQSRLHVFRDTKLINQ